ncbi:MAG: Lipid A export ATP-binding/permease protein MsbA, partial [uncultured Gemmatimonadaceae bacterium]
DPTRDTRAQRGRPHRAPLPLPADPQAAPPPPPPLHRPAGGGRGLPARGGGGGAGLPAGGRADARRRAAGPRPRAAQPHRDGAHRAVRAAGRDELRAGVPAQLHHRARGGPVARGRVRAPRAALAGILHRPAHGRAHESPERRPRRAAVADGNMGERAVAADPLSRGRGGAAHPHAPEAHAHDARGGAHRGGGGLLLRAAAAPGEHGGAGQDRRRDGIGRRGILADPHRAELRARGRGDAALRRAARRRGGGRGAPCVPAGALLRRGGLRRLRRGVGGALAGWPARARGHAHVGRARALSPLRHHRGGRGGGTGLAVRVVPGSRGGGDAGVRAAGHPARRGGAREPRRARRRGARRRAARPGVVPLRAGAARRADGGVAAHRARRDGGAGGAERRGEDHRGVAGAALLGRHRRPHHAGRPRRAVALVRGAARGDRARAAGARAVLGDRARQHRVRAPRGHRRRGDGRRARRARVGVHRATPARLRDARGRARGEALRRAAAAARDRARVPQGPRRGDPRRGHLEPRHRERAAGGGGDGDAARGALDAHHRAPPEHRAPRRPCGRPRPRPRGGGGHPRRAAGARGGVREALSGAVPRRGGRRV